MFENAPLKWWTLSHVGSQTPDAADFVQTATTFGAALTTAGRAVILLTRGEQGAPKAFVGIPATTSNTILVDALASTVKARAVVLDEAPLVDTTFDVVQVFAAPEKFGGHATQAGRDPSAIATLVEASMPANSWLAVGLRGPSKAEIRRTRRWFEHRVGAATMHYSKTTKPLLATLTGGGDAQAMSDFLKALVPSLPGFDVEVRVKALPGRLPLTLESVALGGVAAGGSWYAELDPRIAAGAATTAGVVALASTTGVIPSPRDRTVKVLRRDSFPFPGSKNPLLVSKPRRESTDAQGKVRPESAGSYPLHANTLWLAPEQVASMAVPHYGTAAGAGETHERAVPPALTEPIGPLIGYAGGTGVHISAADLWSGMAIFGVAGSGKSVLIHSLFAAECLDRRNAVEAAKGEAVRRFPDRPGRNNAMIVFESKGADGVEAYRGWARATGNKFAVVDINDAASYALAMVPDGSASDKAMALTSSMVYAFGDAAIAARSQNTLRSVFTLAFLIKPQDFRDAGLDPATSYMEAADILLLGQGPEAGQRLFDTMVARLAEDPDDTELAEALQRCERLWGPKVTVSQRSTLAEAPQSKVALLAALPSWWRDERPRLSFDDVLNRHRRVIINSGTPSNGGRPLDDELAKRLSSMLMFALQHAIVSNCNNWQKQGRHVTLFSDELSLLAGTSGSVLLWMRNQGRSYGVRLILATQYPGQLEPDVRSAVMGFGTLAWFSQSDPTTIKLAVEDLTKDGSAWSSSDLATMPLFHAIVRATVAGRPQPAVLVKMGFWDEDPEAFKSVQGFA